MVNASERKEASEFDAKYDVIVVGYGYAGGIAAIEAHDAGSSVLLIDKMAIQEALGLAAVDVPSRRRCMGLLPRRKLLQRHCRAFQHGWAERACD